MWAHMTGLGHKQRAAFPASIAGIYVKTRCVCNPRAVGMATVHASCGPSGTRVFQNITRRLPTVRRGAELPCLVGTVCTCGLLAGCLHSICCIVWQLLGVRFTPLQKFQGHFPKHVPLLCNLKVVLRCSTIFIMSLCIIQPHHGDL